MGADLVLTPAEYVDHGRLSLSGAQRAVAELILAAFTADGFSAKVAMGAVANAYAESRLDPNAVAGFKAWSGADHQPLPGKENSVGLFQLNAKGGGYGMTVAERKDPRANINRIIEELRAAERKNGPVVTGAATGAQAAKAFCIYVERPSNAAARGAERAEFAQALFGDFATSPKPPNITVSLPQRVTHQTRKVASVPVIIGLGGLAFTMLLFWLGTRGGGTMKRRRQRRPWRIT